MSRYRHRVGALALVKKLVKEKENNSYQQYSNIVDSGVIEIKVNSSSQNFVTGTKPSDAV